LASELRIYFLLFLVLLDSTALAEDLTGVPTITDGDTVVLGGTKIRLLDMDAPETDQFCLDARGESWSCGVAAREALKARVRADEWRCVGDKLDRYGRLLASCTVGEVNISSWMLKEGWALSPIQRGYRAKVDRDCGLAHL
jgi:endonuclease YncB( thermonuclease family)